MNLTAWIVLGVILAIALFFWSLPFWAEPRRAPKHRSSGYAEGGEVRPYEGDGVPIVLVDNDLEHQAWLRSMTDPQTPEDYARAHEGAERLRAAMHEQALVEADAFLREMTDEKRG